MDFTKVIKILIFTYSGFLVVLSFLTGKSIDANILRWASGGAGVVTILFILYEKWIWKMSVFKKISEYQGVPILHGTWKGVIQFDRDAAGNPGEINVYLSITQTLFTIEICTFVETSKSYSVCAAINTDASKKQQLVYLYRSGAPYGKRENNRPHDGTCVLDIIGHPVRQLDGSYFTERKGSGRTIFKEHIYKTSETLEQAKTLLP